MKPSSTLRSCLSLGGSSLIVISTSSAQIYWDGGTANWGATTAWSTDAGDINLDPAASPIGTDDVVFSSTAAAEESITHLNAARAANSLTFSTGFNTFLRSASSGATAWSLTINGGGVTINPGAGAVTINDTPVTYGTLTTTLGASQAWTHNDDSLLSVGPVNLGGNTLTLTGTGAGGTTLGGVISGAGGALTVDRSGSGAVVLSNTGSTYSGQLTVAKGVLSIASINNASSNGVLGNSALAVILGSNGNTGTLSYTGATASSSKPFIFATGGSGTIRVDNAGAALTLSGLFSGSGDLVKTGPGTLILSNNSNNYSGKTVVNGGILQIGTAYNAGELSVPGGYTSNPTTGSNIELSGGLLSYWFSFNRSLGTGAGQIQITGGTSGFIQRQGDRTDLTFNNAATLVTWGSATFNPDVLVLNDAGAANSITFNNLLNLDGANRTIATNNATHGAIMNNVISNSGVTPAGLIKTGVGNLRLNSANTYNGATLISAGTLTIGNGGTTGSLSTSSVITTDATLAFNRTNTLTQGTNFANGILGTGGITQAGTGTTILSGTNSYGGNTRGNAGVLLATVPTAIPGWDAAGRVIFNGGTIGAVIGGPNWTTAEVDTLLSNATKTSGALGIDTTNGNLTQWTAFAGGAGNFGALGLTKLGANTLTLDQANTYTGPTRVVAGILKAGLATVAGVSGPFGVNSAVTVDNVSGASLDLNGFDTQLGSLAGGGTTGGSVTLGGATLTVGASNTNTTFAGTLTGTGNLVKIGTGVFSLSNASTNYSGTTAINAGVLDFGAIASANIGGGTGRNITVAAGAAVRFNALTNALLNRIVETADEITVMTGTTSNNLDFSSSTGANLPNAFLGNWAGNGAKMEYSGTLTPASDNYRLGGRLSSGLLGIVGANRLTGSRGLIVGGTGATGIRVNLAAAQDFTGDTVINTGARLTLGNNLALQNSALNVGSAGGNFSCAAGSNGGRITGESAASSPTFGGLIGSRNLLTVFSNSAGNNETNLAATAVTGFTLNPGTGKTCSYSGIIANFAPATTITKTGDGTQIFSGANTYTGATAVNAGRLFINGNQTAASGTVTVAANATLGGTGTIGGDVSISDNGKLEFQFSTDAATHDKLDLATGKAISFGANATLTITSTGGASPGLYTLVTAPGGVGTLPAFTVNLPAGWTAGAPTVSGTDLVINITSVGGGSGYAAWQTENGTAGGRDDDHDGDGIPNGVEHFLGGTANTTGYTHPLPGVAEDGGSLSVTWTKAATYTGVYGTDFVVETSDVLTGAWTTETLGVNVTITGNDVKFTFPGPLSGKDFARLRVTGP